MSDAKQSALSAAKGARADSLFESLFDGTGDAVFVFDQAGTCQRANRCARDLLGYAAMELDGRRAADVVNGGVDADELAGDSISPRADQPIMRRYTLRHKDGHAIPVEMSLRRVAPHGGAILGIVHDPVSRALDERGRQDRKGGKARDEARAAERGNVVAVAEPRVTAAELPAYFAVAVSHELRTPLTTILGSAEALLRAWTRLDNAARRRSVERILSGARRLDLLVRDLLLVTGLEEGDLVVRPARTPLAPVLEQAIYDASAAHPNLDVRARGLRTAPVVWADPDRVQQIVEHLLDNAARHGQGAGPPEVRVETHAGQAEIRVSDRGPGVPRAGRERLFTRFGKLTQESHAGRVGTGLGLYICRRLVERMGGAIGVDSTPGKGASFWFTLPLAEDADADG